METTLSYRDLRGRRLPPTEAVAEGERYAAVRLVAGPRRDSRPDRDRSPAAGEAGNCKAGEHDEDGR